MSARVWVRSVASRLESGSSIKKAWGERTIARARATRWRWPPESWPGRRSEQPVRPSVAAAVSAPSGSRSAFSTPRWRSGNSMFLATVRCG